jgi:hypothetical protein
MKTITVLNIPNFYSSYYLLGLSQEFKVRFKIDKRFIKFNNKPLLVFQVNDKIGVIDNDDPTGVDQELYDLTDIYFATNKLIDDNSYNQKKVKPLYPHYPVNILPLYLSLFGLNLVRFIKIKDVAREIYILMRRPPYKKYKGIPVKGNFVFFSSNIWKKEPQANDIRAEFMRFCKEESRIEFEGGFIPRCDGDNLGFDKQLNSVRYSPRKFAKLNSKSKIVLNNPAVCGAVSWRLAEYLNQGLFVLSFPFKIELPQNIYHGQQSHFIESTTDYKSIFDYISDNPEYHEKVAISGKNYFDVFCAPKAQAKYVIDQLLKV